MSTTELVEDVVDRLGVTASVRTVYGERVTEGGRTVIPVARVAYGFGGGTGDGVEESTVERPGEQARMAASAAMPSQRRWVRWR